MLGSAPSNPKCVPLSCVVRGNNDAKILHRVLDKENHMSVAKLPGKVFERDSEKVHVHLLLFPAKNSEALLTAKDTGNELRCGCKDWLAPSQCCLGSGTHPNDLVSARDDLNDSDCTGENHPKMVCTKFESCLSNACGAMT